MTEKIKKVHEASNTLLTDGMRNKILKDIASSLEKHTNEILKENEKDLKQMNQEDPRYDRLLLTKERIEGVAKEIHNVTSLSSPLNKILEERTMENGLNIQRISVPLGVIAIIYEARPNVTIDVFSLCFKSGNACLLKGGKEAIHSNTVLVKIIKDVLSSHQVSPDFVELLTLDREETKILLQNPLIDVCIPRGSQALINFVREHAKIPVIETGAGVVHVYFDKDGDLQKGKDIIYNAKTRRVSVCNALDCLLVHKNRVSDIFELIKKLADKKVEIFADSQSFHVLSGLYPYLKSECDYGEEFLDYKMSIKIVDSCEEALQHIKKYSAKNGDAIVTENKETAEQFINYVDSASVFINVSTAFSDGAQFGLGAEIGISTQKLHARGPMGLEALTSYKWVVRGNGQIRA